VGFRHRRRRPGRRQGRRDPAGEGFAGRVTLIGTEPSVRTSDRRSPRACCSARRAATSPTCTTGLVRHHDVELRTGTTVSAIDPAAPGPAPTTATTIGYDKLLLATGASPRTIGVPGAGRRLTLRTSPTPTGSPRPGTAGTRLVVIGAGWIGLEVAAAARLRGAAVTVVEALRAAAAARPRRPARRRSSPPCTASTASTSGSAPRSSELTPAPGVQVLADGTTIDADVVLVAASASPRTPAGRPGRAAVDNGVLVDRHLRTATRTSTPPATSRPSTTRCSAPGSGSSTGPTPCTAARSPPARCSARTPGMDRLPYFFTDQYDLGMEYAGWVPPGAEARGGDPRRRAGREFIAFWTVDGRVLAGMNVNVWDVTDADPGTGPRRAGRARRRPGPARRPVRAVAPVRATSATARFSRANRRLTDRPIPGPTPTMTAPGTACSFPPARRPYPKWRRPQDSRLRPALRAGRDRRHRRRW
jgi:3-phenylpropionate/trans-cinnamate dioxygenase ferredoxin reductase subunit